MSYSITFVKDAEGIHLNLPSISGLACMPNGKYTVSGHEVDDGEAGSEWISISLTRAGVRGSLGASSNYTVDRRPPAPPAPAPFRPVEGMPAFTVPQ